MNVLVDTSVWIDFFRNKANTKLEELIKEYIIVTNYIILTELIPALCIQNQREVIESLQSIDSVPLTIDWDLIRNYQIINLPNGINKVGIPDLLILQQVVENNLTLCTLDKHFALMQSHFDFKIH